MKIKISIARSAVLATMLVLRATLLQEKRRLLLFGLGSPEEAPPEGLIDEVCVKLKKVRNHGYRPHGYKTCLAGFQRQYRRMGVKTDSENFVIGDGSRGIIYHFTYVAFDGVPKREKIGFVPDPCYGAFVDAIEEYGGRVYLVPCGEGVNYVDGIEALLQKGVIPAFVVVNFFHNPTGVGISRRQLRCLVKLARKYGFLILSDRTYAELAFDSRKPTPSIFQIPGAWGYAFETFTLSKLFNLAGWRIGGGVGDVELAKKVNTRKAKFGYGVSLPSQIAASLAFDGFYRSVVRQQKEYEERAELWCRHLPGAKKPAGGMFVWWEIPQWLLDAFGALDATEFCQIVLRLTGVEFWPGEAFGSRRVARNRVRISLGQPQNVIHQALARLAKARVIEAHHRTAHSLAMAA